MVTTLRRFNLALRGAMEAGIVAALAYFGYTRSVSFGWKLLLAFAVPAAIFGVWGFVDFRSAGSMAEWLRLLEELVLSALAALALYVAGQRGLAWSLIGLSLVHHALVYSCGDRLLQERS